MKSLIIAAARVHYIIRHAILSWNLYGTGHDQIWDTSPEQKYNYEQRTALTFTSTEFLYKAAHLPQFFAMEAIIIYMHEKDCKHYYMPASTFIKKKNVEKYTPILPRKLMMQGSMFVPTIPRASQLSVQYTHEESIFMW